MSDLRASNCGCNSAQNSRVNEIYNHLSMANAPLAIAYVPYQQWETPSSLRQGLQNGTIFPALCKPFCGKGGKCW